MTKGLAAALVALGLAVSSGSARASFTGLFAFGDSLSDAGNLYLGTSGISPIFPLPPPTPLPSPPSPPYYDGHFSNGPTWVEDLNKALGFGTLEPSGFPAPLSPTPFSPGGGTDFAVGGAQTGSTLAGTGTFDLDLQVEAFGEYLGLHPSTPVSTDLFTLDIGANDIINAIKESKDVDTVVSQAAANTLTSVTDLFDDGVKNLLFYEVPDLGLTPTFDGTPEMTAASSAAKDFNTDLLAGLHSLKQDGLNVFVLDTYTLLDDIVADPSKYGFSNVTTPCIGLATCNGYLFFDDLHPTEAGHALAAEYALAAIPEPSTWAMMLLGFAGLGFMGYKASRKAAAVTA